MKQLLTKEKHFSSILLHFLCASLVHWNTLGQETKSESESTFDSARLNSNYSSGISNVSQGQYNLTEREQEVISSMNSSYENIVQSQSDNSSVSFNTSNFLPIENGTDGGAGGIRDIKEIRENNSTTMMNSSFSSSTNENSKSKPLLSPEDQRVRMDWKGNCTQVDWKKCSSLKTLFGDYYQKIKKSDPKKQKKDIEIDCTIQPFICMNNGWTVTRCQILCMGRCNKDLLSKYDKYVKKEGMC